MAPTASVAILAQATFSSSEGRPPAAAAGAQLPWHTFDGPAPRTGDPPARRRCPLMPAGVLGAP
eukprot:9495268-Pyramimonas_sp.AAC.1